MQSLAFLPLDNEAGADQERPYPPTAHRLERLRAHAAGPHSPVLRAAAAAFVALALLGAGLVAGRAVFTAMLARCCTAATAADAPAAAALISQASLPVAALLVAFLMAIACAAWLADGLSAGFGWAGPRRRALSGLQTRLWAALRATAVATVAVATSILAAMTITKTAATARLSAAHATLVLALAIAFTAALFLAAIDWAMAYAQFLAAAWMSRAEMTEELRETRGPELWRIRRARTFFRRRHR